MGYFYLASYEKNVDQRQESINLLYFGVYKFTLSFFSNDGFPKGDIERVVGELAGWLP